MLKYFILLIHSDAAPVRTASTRQTFVDALWMGGVYQRNPYTKTKVRRQVD